jgi:cyclopropane fatty-acyl-phospholipid synthase-like methyltransferase
MTLAKIDQADCRPMNAQALIQQEIPALPFPLNVYADVLCLETGAVQYLHYGFFESAEDTPQAAQERSTELLLEQLGSTPQTILEVGIGLGTTLDRLHGLGHRVCGITPDPAQIRIARARTPGATVHHTTLEAFDTSERFDTLLFQESAQYIESPLLWQKAATLLKPGGRLLVLDEFSLWGGGTLPPLKRFCELGESHGYRLAHQHDLSKAAAHTLRFLLDAVARHRSTLLRLPGLSDGMLEELQASNLRYQTYYDNGDYGYYLMTFEHQG